MAARPARDQLTEAEDEVLDMFAGAHTVKQVAAHYDVSRSSLWRWLNEDPERLERYETALKGSADVWAEKAADVLEAAKPRSTAEVQLAKALSDFYWRMAERRDRRQYGEDRGRIDVNMTVGELHLNALRVHGHMGNIEAGRALELPAVTTDTEVGS